MQSEDPTRKSEKKSILWHGRLFDMLLYRSPKIALKNTQNSPPYGILK